MQQLLTDCLRYGITKKSRDLHFIPECDKVVISQRLMSNRLEIIQELSLEQYTQFTRFLKFEAQLQLGTKLLQCGQFTHCCDHGTYHLRCSFVPTQHGESIVIRLLDRDTQRSFHELTPFHADQQSLESLIDYEEGFIVFSGPTGVGKTTTLYTLIHSLRKNGKSVISIEEPVEKQINGVTQVQIQPDIGITYTSALETALRHDPDVIVLAEIRSEHVLQMAKRAALTGHLVIATIHSGSVKQCFERLYDLGIHERELALILRFISSQQLYVCNECVYGIYEYLTQSQIDDWFSGKKVEYETLASKKAAFTQTANFI
ncbi:MAG: ATPase, T2SS/T4P/T4SS family [Culicoidibacterales bacterium]